ncbi:DUF7668 domain-containing protein [Halomonas sp. V046]|uniref:DUF7668 domain-containing protein n=1 Tax=Halomonas sp. V046 TaxID=3459611 RepID=UPI0040444B5D
MTKNEIERIVRKIVDQLVQKQYSSLEKETDGIRLTSKEISNAVDGYGRNLIQPPNSAFSDIDAIKVDIADADTWSIRFDLWTEQEGRSDLSLEATLIKSADKKIRIELDDIHVM